MLTFPCQVLSDRYQFNGCNYQVLLHKLVLGSWGTRIRKQPFLVIQTVQLNPGEEASPDASFSLAPPLSLLLLL